MKRLGFKACVLCITLSVVAIARPQGVFRAREYRRAHEAEIINEFVDLLSIPNVASDIGNMRRNAARIIEMMGRRGIDARLLEGNGPPAIFGELKAPGATRTIGFYAHYAGQPVDETRWEPHR